MENSKRNHWIFAAKVFLAAALFYFLYKYKLINFVLLQNIFHDPLKAFIILICLFLGIFIQAIRWYCLLKAADVHLNLKFVINLTLMGSFFSIYLPGIMGGDAIRVLYLYRYMHVNRGLAIVVLIIDRLFSLLGLLCVAAITYYSLPKGISSEFVLATYGHIIKFLLFAAFGGIITVFVSARFFSQRILQASDEQRIFRYLKPIVSIILTYQQKLLALGGALFLSIVASSTVVVGIVLLSSLFPFEPAKMVSAIAGVFANLSSAIPLTPGGIGIAESVFTKVCTDLSSKVAPYATIYFSFRLAMLCVNIPGIISYLCLKRPIPKSASHERLLSY